MAQQMARPESVRGEQSVISLNSCVYMLPNPAALYQVILNIEIFVFKCLFSVLWRKYDVKMLKAC